MEQNGHVVGDELQAVTVARKDICTVIFAAGIRKCSQNIVRLEAGAFDNAYAHITEDILDKRHLHGKLIGHTVAVCLVCGACLVAERRLFQVESHGTAVGRDIPRSFKIDVHKSRKGVGERTFFVGKRLYAVKCTVHNAVSVNSQQLHRVTDLSYLKYLKSLVSISRMSRRTLSLCSGLTI